MTSPIAVAALHQKTFEPYKNMYEGQTLVLVATAPSLNQYTQPIERAIHVGVNKAYQREDLGYECRYMFVEDYKFAKGYFDKFCSHANSKNPVKFFGIVPNGAEQYTESRIPHSALQKHGLDYSYSVDHPHARTEPTLNIVKEPLFDGGSVVFKAMQFILYTNPSKIYIVGCDCSSAGHFDSATNNVFTDETTQKLIDSWHKIAEFAKNFYPETEIISVNPVGLKGLFKDMTMS